LHARLLLAARGVKATRKALAGALIEAERDALLIGYIRGKCEAARKARARRG
jgi:hypothetical protein